MQSSVQIKSSSHRINEELSVRKKKFQVRLPEKSTIPSQCVVWEMRLPNPNIYQDDKRPQVKGY